MKYGNSGQTKIGLAMEEELAIVDPLVLVTFMIRYFCVRRVLEIYIFGFKRQKVHLASSGRFLFSDRKQSRCVTDEVKRTDTALISLGLGCGLQLQRESI